MGIVDKLKNVSNWEQVVIVSVFLGCCTAIILVGSQVVDQTSSQLMVVGGLVALGIPTSFLGNVGNKVAAVAANSSNNSNGTKEELVTLKSEINDLRISMANILNEVLTLKNDIVGVKNE